MTDDTRADATRPSNSRSAAGDPELIVAARTGDGAAFLVLRHRHEMAAFRLATLVVGPDDAAAVTERAFDHSRRTLESGGGPDSAFRLQILRDVRTAAGTPAANPVEADPALDATAAMPPTRAVADPIVRRSFLALPERWGSALWHTDVEQQTDAEVAALLGMRTVTVTGLAARSREGLVRGYLAGQVHQLDDPACAAILDALSDSVGSAATAGPGAVVLPAAVQEHLDGCTGCRTAARTLTALTHDLGAVLAVVVLGEYGIPYLEAAETASTGARVVPAGAAGRPRSLRLALVAVALIAVTASVPALRAGAGSDPSAEAPAAAAFDPAVAGAVDNGPASTDGSSAAGVVPTTATAGPTTGRATITTTGADGVPTRVEADTMTSMGVDGVPTTIAVIPGDPATTVTGVADDDPGSDTWTTASPTDSAPPATEQGVGPTGTGSVATTGQYTPPLFGPQGPRTSGPAAPGTAGPATTRPGTTAPWTTVLGTTVPAPAAPGTTAPGATAPGTTRTTTAQDPGTSSVTTATTGRSSTGPTPTSAPAPSTSDEEPTSESATSDTSTTDTSTSDGPTTGEPTIDGPTTDEPAPAADVRVFAPLKRTVEIVRLLDPTAEVEFTVENRTAGTIGEQQLTVTLPEGVDVRAGGGLDGCARQDESTYTCTLRGMAESDAQQQIALTLTAGPEARTGALTVSVTGNEASVVLIVL